MLLLLKRDFFYLFVLFLCYLCMFLFFRAVSVISLTVVLTAHN